jgi:O-antigen/teichoic acid export membrane protein
VENPWDAPARSGIGEVLKIEPRTASTEQGVQPSLRDRLVMLWNSRSVWAIADQGVLSLGNFLCGWILARHLPEAEFGTYALVVMTIILQLNNLHIAFVGFALTVRGATLEEHALRRLTGVSLAITGGVLVVGMVTIVTGLIIFQHTYVIPFAIFALVGWQLQETVRRALIARMRYRAAMIGDAISYLGQVVPIAYLAHTNQLTVTNALLMNGTASVLAMCVQLLQVKVERFTIADLRQGLKQAWELGRWLLGSNALAVLVIPIIPWTLAFYYNETEVAGYQAMSMILGISHPVLFSLCNIIMPAVAKANAESGIAAARAIGMKYAAQGAMLVLPYYTAVILVPDLVLRVFYGADSHYLDLGYTLRLFAICYVIQLVSQIFLAVLNGLEKTSVNFHSQLAAAGVTIVALVPLTAHAGLVGASWSRIIKGAVGVGVAVWVWWRLWHHATTTAPAAAVAAAAAATVTDLERSAEPVALAKEAGI